MRSLNADSFRPSLAGLLFAMAILGAWAAWFFLARITLYETSQTARVTRDQMIVADFDPEALRRIRRGQLATLRLDAAAGEQAKAIPAIVLRVADHAQQGQGQVELYALANTDSVPLQEGLTGRVEIKVEHISPATLVMRASGQALDAPQISLKSQDSQD